MTRPKKPASPILRSGGPRSKRNPRPGLRGMPKALQGLDIGLPSTVRSPGKVCREMGTWGQTGLQTTVLQRCCTSALSRNGIWDMARL